MQFKRISRGFVKDETEELQYEHPCFLCENPLKVRIISFPEFQFYSDSAKVSKRLKLEVFVCLSCNLIQNNPIPKESTFKIILEEAGKSYGSSPSHMQDQVNHLLDKKIISPDVSVLDVGCYEGSFLGLLPSYVKCTGIDVDDDAITRGNTRFTTKSNIVLIESGFEDFQSEVSFDVILMYHVLEHLVNPKQVLINLSELANPNASLVVEVPILESGMTNDINGFFAPLHLTHFSASTLAKMLNESGWIVEEEIYLSSYNGYRVVAKPGKRLDLDSKLSNDIKSLELYLSHDHKNSIEINRRLRFLETFSTIIIWGAGIHLELLFQKCEYMANSKKKYLIVDSDPRKWGTSWRGINIMDPTSIIWEETKDSALLIANYSAQNEIYASAISLGVPAERILRLYENIVSY